MHRLLSIVLILLLAAPVSAQGYGRASTGLSDRTTNAVVRLLERGLRQCRALETVYRYDCYRQNYGDAARKLGDNPAYAPARTALRSVESRLEQVLRADADPSAPRLRRGGKTFSAIQSDATPRSRAALSAALDQAQTQLLRSPDGAGDHFARIANVLDSEKVFLRS